MSSLWMVIKASLFEGLVMAVYDASRADFMNRVMMGIHLFQGLV